MTDQQTSIFFVQGGAGDVIAHTPMIRFFRKAYPQDKIVVVSTYAQLWENNPNVDLVLPAKDIQDFYEEHVLRKNVRFFKKHFVYDAILDTPAQHAKTLPEFICRVYDAEYDQKPLDYYITDKENKVARVFLDQYTPLNKKIVLLHCTGAIPSDGAGFSKTNKLKDLDTKRVAELVKKYAGEILFIQIGLIGEPVVEGAIDALGMTMREAIALIRHADSFVFIESLFAHCSNALQKTGVVVFQNTSPSFFGYSNNHNISFSGGCDIWPCNRPVGALMDCLPGYRNPKTRERLLWECPDQKCARMPLEELEKALLESLARPLAASVDGPAAPPTKPLEVARGNPYVDALRRQNAVREAEQR